MIRNTMAAVFRPHVLRTALVFTILACVACSVAASAATYYVNVQSPAASDSGAGTLASPFRTINGAVKQHSGPGTTIQVLPGTYRERVTIAATRSGASGNPFVLQASGPGVIVDGADVFSGTGNWSPFSGNVYRANGVNWIVAQVFVDGARLLATTGPAGSIGSDTFLSDSTGLYVNVGSGNPGSHAVLVGHRLYGFDVNAASWVTIQNFEIQHSDSKGVYLLNGANNIEVSGNHVTWARLYGVHEFGGSNVLVQGNTIANSSDHGIYLSNGATSSTIRGNESFGNARPTTRAANGIQLFASSGNRIENNLLHDNQDSGLQMSGGANNNVSLQNRSWNNGDHGFDHLASTGDTHIGDVAYGNFTDGFSFEGGSTGGTMADCISAENAKTTTNLALLVDSLSTAGFHSDYDILWSSTATRVIHYDRVFYTSLPTFNTATGNEAHGLQVDPRFVSPAAADFHLQAGSPAIDDASSENPLWPALDAEGHARFDDLGVANTGVGPVLYADRGALEFEGSTPVNQPPVADLVARPASGTAPLDVQLDATGSHDDGRIVSYRFEPGDGSGAVTQAGATLTHRYGNPGTFTARVTVTDDGGLTARDSALVTVTGVPPADRPPVVTAPAKITVTAGQTLTENVAAGDPDNDAITSFTVDKSGLPAGNDATFTTNGARTAGTLTWHPALKDTGSYVVRFIAANALADTASTTIKVAAPVVSTDHPPIVTAPSKLTFTSAQTVLVPVAAVDPDGQAITSFTADKSGLPSGNDATFTTNSTKNAGLLTWHPTSADTGTFKVKFTASNTLSGSATTTIVIEPAVDNPPVVISPSSLFAVAGQTLTFRVAAYDPDKDAIRSLTMDPFHMPSNSGATFTVTDANMLGTFTWHIPAGTRGNFRVVFTASNDLSGSHGTNIHVKNATSDAWPAGLDGDVPPVLALSNAYPNPAHAEVSFALDLPAAAHVSWAVFDLQGRAVFTQERDYAAGSQRLVWNGTTAAGERANTGIYLVRVRAGATEFTRRAIRF